MKIHINFDKKDNYFKKYTTKKRDDGMVEYYATYELSKKPITFLEFIKINFKKFNVEIYFEHDSDSKDYWEPYLNTFNNFFNFVGEKQLKNLCNSTVNSSIYSSSSFDFSFDIFNVLPEQSIQDNIFIEKYTGWPYFQFNKKFSGIYTIKEFRENLENDFNIYEVYDRDWPETKIFIKKLTPENIKKTFDLILILNNINNEILEEMNRAQKTIYELNSTQWIKHLKSL